VLSCISRGIEDDHCRVVQKVDGTLRETPWRIEPESDGYRLSHADDSSGINRPAGGQTTGIGSARAVASAPSSGSRPIFLTVADVSGLMRGMRVRNQARGSGAGSLVMYLLRISNVDPFEHDLLFERFFGDKRSPCPTSISTSSPHGGTTSTGQSSTAAATTARRC